MTTEIEKIIHSKTKTGGYIMKEKNIQELAIRMGLITVEDMCQYTISQLVVKIANKVNELVNEVWRFETDVQEILKTQNENIQYLLGEGLHLEVGNIFDGWKQDGTFDTLLNHSALKKVNERIDETNVQLINIEESFIHYTILDEEKKYAKNNGIQLVKSFPYGHVHRYGAKGDGINDDTKAIQMAVDMCEQVFNKSSLAGSTPVQFSGGIYKITKTIKVKYDDNMNISRPISFKGVDMGGVSSRPTRIKPLIHPSNELNYATAFSIHSRWDGENDTDTCTSGSSTPAKVCNCVSFENITFTLGINLDGSITESERSSFTIKAIKVFNTRLHLKNMTFEYMDHSVYMPRKSGQMNDMNRYYNINIKDPKSGGLFLTATDCLILEGLQSHNLSNTKNDSLIDINRGSGITITNVHGAEFGETINGVFIPINIGSGASGNKSMFKFTDVYGVSIDSTYVERPFWDYVVYLNGVTNFKISNHNERFFSNGFIKLVNENRNIMMNNIYRYSNKVTEYSDIAYANSTTYGLKCKNFICREYYNINGDITLNHDFRTSSNTKLENYVPRQIKTTGLTYSNKLKNGCEGEDIQFLMEWNTTDGVFKASRFNGDSINGILGDIKTDKNGNITFLNEVFSRGIIKQITHHKTNPTSSSTVIPFVVMEQNQLTLQILGSSNVLTPETYHSQCKLLVTMNVLDNINYFYQ